MQPLLFCSCSSCCLFIHNIKPLCPFFTQANSYPLPACYRFSSSFKSFLHQFLFSFITNPIWFLLQRLKRCRLYKRTELNAASQSAVLNLNTRLHSPLQLLRQLAERERESGGAPGADARPLDDYHVGRRKHPPLTKKRWHST